MRWGSIVAAPDVDSADAVVDAVDAESGASAVAVNVELEEVLQRSSVTDESHSLG